MMTYEVVVTRSGRWWAIEVPGLRMGFSQARRLDEVEAVVRELIAGLTDTAEDSFEIAVRVERDGSTSTRVIGSGPVRRQLVATVLTAGPGS